MDQTLRSSRGVYALKPWFICRLRFAQDGLIRRKVSPNAISCATIGISAVAAAIIVSGHFFWSLLWLAVPLLCIARLAGNALDGAVARRTACTSRFGEAVNEIADRACDVLFIAPLAFVVAPALAFGALAAALSASLIGVLAGAITGVRDTGGPMGKADRMAVVATASIVAVWTPAAWTVAAAVLLGGSLMTAALRVVRLRRACLIEGASR